MNIINLNKYIFYLSNVKCHRWNAQLHRHPYCSVTASLWGSLTFPRKSLQVRPCSTAYRFTRPTLMRLSKGRQQKYEAVNPPHTLIFFWLVVWHSGRTSVFGRRTFLVLRSTCIWRVTSYMGKSSAAGQPTRPTQPLILSGSINKYAIGCPLWWRHLVNAYGVKGWCGWLGRWCAR